MQKITDFFMKLGDWFWDTFPSTAPVSTEDNPVNASDMEQRQLIVGVMVIVVPLLLLCLLFSRKKRTYKRRTYKKRTYKRKKK